MTNCIISIRKRLHLLISIITIVWTKISIFLSGPKKLKKNQKQLFGVYTPSKHLLTVTSEYCAKHFSYKYFTVNTRSSSYIIIITRNVAYIFSLIFSFFLCVEFLKGTGNYTGVKVHTRKNKRNYAYRERVAWFSGNDKIKKINSFSDLGHRNISINLIKFREILNVNLLSNISKWFCECNSGILF